MPDLPEDERRAARDLARIARINEVSAMARTSWITLLAYLAFVMVTLLGVEDADFFVPSRQTDLPLVNVAIPTASFFWFAPALGAALYVYLHIVLLKLWDAIADLERPLVDGHPVGDLINPWLANDWALTRKGAAFRPARPLRVLGNAATFCLVWAAGLLVLFFAWWWSMPAHKEGLTLWLGLCLIVAGLAGLDSWRAARAWLTPPRREPVHRPLWRRPGVLAASAAVVVASWAGTEGGLDRYAGATVDLANRWLWPGPDPERPTGYLRRCYPTDFPDDPQAERPPLPDCFDAHGVLLPRDMVQERRIAAVWPGLDDLTLTLPVIGSWNPLARTEIEGVEMVARPDGWRDFDAARRSYRETWCKREGLEMAVCGQPATTDEPVPEHVGKQRRAWCARHEVPAEGVACKDHFAEFDRRFAEDWRAERAAVIADLPGLNLAGQDLRNAAGSEVMLEGADLRGARLEGANLTWARLEGANLTWARLEGAVLWLARLEGAKLGEARLEGANLTLARLEGANLIRARLEGANLSNARLEGAYLGGARLEGASLTWAQLEGADLRGARLEGAKLSEARLERADLTGARLEGADLTGARLEGADLTGARLEGASLRWADFHDTNWAGVSNGASPAQFADFRTSQDLTQSQLGHVIGNEQTLLPNRPNGSGRRPHDPTGDAYYVWSCWETPPDDLDAIIARAAGSFADDADRENLRREFLCGPGNPRRRTGTPLALDAPYPPGHPFLARRD
jgi:uncharacterized protein YjbI with pentapeptide repeats